MQTYMITDAQGKRACQINTEENCGDQGQNRTADTRIFSRSGRSLSPYLSTIYPERPLPTLHDNAGQIRTDPRKIHAGPFKELSSHA